MLAAPDWCDLCPHTAVRREEPPYSPELNPGGYVWNDLKNDAFGRRPITSREESRGAVTTALGKRSGCLLGAGVALTAALLLRIEPQFH